MWFGLQIKDIVGPCVSIAAALLSVLFFYKNYSLSQKAANRSIYVDGQKFLIEICKQLISDPEWWCVYDDHPLIAEIGNKIEDPRFEAKLSAFTHLHLNMFEIILNEAPDPGKGHGGNPSNVWVNYFHDTLSRSRRLREVLEASEGERIWSPVILAEYQRWKDPSNS